MAKKDRRMVLVVLDYSNGRVQIMDVPQEWHDLEHEEIACNMGVDTSNSEWMLVEKELLVEVKTQALKGELTF